VPGCSGTPPDPMSGYDNDKDYCTIPPLPPSGHLAYVYDDGGNRPFSHYDKSPPLGECEGDCDDDNDCAGDLKCFQRSGTEAVPGCASGDSIYGQDKSGKDYCYRDTPATSPPTQSPTSTCAPTPAITPPPTGPATYIPGENTLFEADLNLSTGLRAEVIAWSGQKVVLSSGQVSAESFHGKPDGAAVFADECGGGWTYVSNCEEGGSSSYTGGVGALYFNAQNEVVDYKMIQKSTRRNCSGGKTWWNTWVTCEETNGGGVYEVHPKNNNPNIKRKTLLGQNGRNGGHYEGVAYDNRFPDDANFRPKLFLTEDTSSGPLERFQPSVQALADAKASGDYSNLLHIDPDNTAQTDYLLITPDANIDTQGTFIWTSSLSAGRDNANSYFQNCEGIDVRNGMLYMTCKADKLLFILNLDAMTYIQSSTKSGAFNDQPDQIAAITGVNGDIMYFCEDGISGGNSGVSGSGVHARDATGQGYTILQDEGNGLAGETTGLAFSPDRKLMIVAYQQGRIYKIWREDGRPFGGQTLDIRYHSAPDNIFAFAE